jgi:DNA invertase Pin-like site-specific DNA recombinase
MFGMLSAFSEFERAIIQERIAAGMARAKAKGTKSGKPWHYDTARRTGATRMAHPTRSASSEVDDSRAAGCIRSKGGDMRFVYGVLVHDCLN